MPLEPSRRGFLGSLIAGAAAARFVRIARPAEVPEIASVAGGETAEIIEYASPAIVQCRAYAKVERDPLRLATNNGFRYVMRSADGMGVRLFYERKLEAGYRCVLVSHVEDDRPDIAFTVTKELPEFVEVRAFDVFRGKYAREPFFVLSMGMV
jgi:hypothetical protein